MSAWNGKGGEPKIVYQPKASTCTHNYIPCEWEYESDFEYDVNGGNATKQWKPTLKRLTKLYCVDCSEVKEVQT